MDVLILNSAQSKCPKGSDPWVAKTVTVIETIARHGDTIIAGDDPIPWDIVTYSAGQCGARVKLIIKAADTEAGWMEYDRLIEDLGLTAGRTEPLFLGVANTSHPKSLWRLRDDYAFRHAEKVFPISLRPGGKLETLIQSQKYNGEIDNRYRIDWTPGKSHHIFENRTLSHNPLYNAEWLVHWTRECHGPWPGEKSADFFADMFSRPDIYVRSALETLIRIASEGSIRASGWRMHDSIPAVSFSSLTPKEALPLMRWRKRYVRLAFEPYGVAVRRDSLASTGGRPVDYVTTNAGLPASDSRVFVQTSGIRGDWTKECEWRFKGDVILSRFKPEDVFLVVPGKKELTEVEKRTNNAFTVFTFFEG